MIADWATVELSGSYSADGPVIIAAVPTLNGAQAAVARITNVRYRDPDSPSSGSSDNSCLGWCFDVRLAEPTCYDGTHNIEEVPWLAVDAGSYTTEDGVLIQAGREPNVGTEERTVTFPRPFPAVSGDGNSGRTPPPNTVVLTNLQSSVAAADPTYTNFAKTRQHRANSASFATFVEYAEGVAPVSAPAETVGAPPGTQTQDASLGVVCELVC